MKAKMYLGDKKVTKIYLGSTPVEIWIKDAPRKQVVATFNKIDSSKIQEFKEEISTKLGENYKAIITLYSDENIITGTGAGAQNLIFTNQTNSTQFNTGTTPSSPIEVTFGYAGTITAMPDSTIIRLYGMAPLDIYDLVTANVLNDIIDNLNVVAERDNNITSKAITFSSANIAFSQVTPDDFMDWTIIQQSDNIPVGSATTKGGQPAQLTINGSGIKINALPSKSSKSFPATVSMSDVDGGITQATFNKSIGESLTVNLDEGNKVICTYPSYNTIIFNQGKNATPPADYTTSWIVRDKNTNEDTVYQGGQNASWSYRNRGFMVELPTQSYEENPANLVVYRTLTGQPDSPVIMSLGQTIETTISDTVRIQCKYAAYNRIEFKYISVY